MCLCDWAKSRKRCFRAGQFLLNQPKGITALTLTLVG